MYRDTKNVEPEIYKYTGNNWSNRNIEKSLKKSFEAMPEKLSTDSLPKTASRSWNIRLVRKVL
jgi:predicted nuclease of predicted toxin-antitoxin system